MNVVLPLNSVTSVIDLSIYRATPLPHPVQLVSTHSLLLANGELPVCPVAMHSPVMETPGQRAALRKAERDSGLSNPEAEAEIDIEYLESVMCGVCSACGVFVGPDHVEKSFYFSFVRNQWVWNNDDTRSYIGKEGYLAFYCGGCAQKRGLPISQRLLDREHCETNYLMVHSLNTAVGAIDQHIIEEPWENQRIASLAHEYMLEQFRWYLLLTMICHKINYRFLFYSTNERKFEEARLRAEAMAKVKEKRRKHSVALVRKQQQDRSLQQIAIPTHGTRPLPTTNTPQPTLMSAYTSDLFSSRCSISSAFPA